MNLKTASLSLLLSVAAAGSFAQDTAAVKKPEINKVKSFQEVITAKAVSKPGLFAVHKVDEKYFFEIPDSLLQKEVLFTTRLVKTPTYSPRLSGELVNSIIVLFEKAGNDKLYVRAATNVAVADESHAIAKAVRNASIDPIIMVMDVKARGKNNTSSIVDMTDFILKDNNITGFNAEAKKVMGVSSSAADRSFILTVNPYQQNIEIKTLKTFTAGAAPKESTAPNADEKPESPITSFVGLTMELSTSVMLLPAQRMQARYADPRVGYYADNYKVYTDAQQRVEEKSFIVRQRLEPKAEDLEKYKRGELVEPKEPIVYYVDPATPKQWRPYIIAGINDWNEAFKAAGFKNAIIGKEWPESDSAMSLEDARCKVVRYFPTQTAFSYSPRVYDPRSGEILQTYIGWSHAKLQSLHEWYFIQAAAVDPQARTMKFSNELMGALIRAAISREVGYSLGLRTNSIASNAYPVEKLRDKHWVEKNGFSASIMDAVHYNYVAQPEDKFTTAGLVPKIGEYDKWAIKYGYTYTGINDFDKEKKEISQWVTRGATDPKFRFASEINFSPSLNDPADPRSQTEDIGNDAIKASEYGMKNLRIVMANLLKWTREDMDMYDNTAAMYDNVVDWYAMLSRHVYSQLGGIHENPKTVEQEGDVYTPVSRETQKRAIAFLQKEVFQTPSWLVDPVVLNKFARPGRKEKVLKLQENALYFAIQYNRLYRMTVETMRYGKEKAYTIEELLTDVEDGVWSELKAKQVVINPYRRSLQKIWLEQMQMTFKEANKAPDPFTGVGSELTTTDVPAVVRMHLEKIMDQCKAAMPATTDPMSLAHVKYIHAKIKKLLDIKN